MADQVAINNGQAAVNRPLIGREDIPIILLFITHLCIKSLQYGLQAFAPQVETLGW